MKSLIFSVALLCYAYSAFSQNEILDSGKRMQTEVFVLNTCEPTQLSLVRLYDENTIVKKINVRRLAASTKRFTAFKIININPLRFNYYINNQLVTNFMENTSINISNNVFINGGLPIQEIEQIKIFGDTLEKSGKLEALTKVREKITELNSNLEFLNDTINTLRMQMYSMEKYDSVNKRYIPIPDLKTQHDKVKDLLDKKYDEYESKSKELNHRYDDYDIISNNLPINDKNFSIINKYSQFKQFLDTVKNLQGDIDRKTQVAIRTVCYQFADDFKKMSSDFDEVLKLMSTGSTATGAVPREPLNENYFRISSILGAYGYTSSYNPNQPAYYKSYTFDLRKESNKIKEFMVDKKFRIYEGFVISLSADIGKTLMRTYRMFSERYITRLNQSCLDPQEVTTISKDKDQLIGVFEEIEDISTDFRVITSYLGIDNTKYKPLVDTINKNYSKLYQFVKYLAHIRNNDVVEYSLPTHTNLKNVDLIRYEIKREDKVVKASQGGQTGQATQTYVYDVWLKGGLKIDLSAGVFASALVDYDYEKLLVPNSPTSTLGDSIHVVRKNKGGYNFGFGGMVNITPRLGANWVNIGMSYGVIYSSNQKLQLLAAGSLHLGKTERIILHGGVSFGFAQTLDKSKNFFVEVEKDKRYAVRADIETYNVPTIDKFRSAAFFGISYNLSKKHALQAVSNQGNTYYNSLMEEPKTKTSVN